NNVWTLTHQNRLKAFDLTVHKKEDNGQTLKGAKFRLQGPEMDLESPKDGQETDTFLFENLKPGTYTLTETFTPEGYQGLKEPVTIVIHEDG
ncbi:prealbumin-like fold domain-containing protein, partial [Enterococcus faecium]|nr:prealbumin-like fold domain-containing protein [Enterococcus faecium]